MNYSECLKVLEDLGHELHGVKFDLQAIQIILESLGQPQTKYPTAIVAGTNGKGSTCAFLSSILRCAGYRTGLYTSPHLVRVNERIRVDGAEISDEFFADAFSQVWHSVENLVALGTLPAHPSFFEILTATAFLRFAQEKVDIAVLEVGMGGRLDATNVTEPRVAVITNIDLDHQAFLGDTIAAIAGEKAGVIKPRRPIVSSVEHPEALAVIRRRAAELDAPLIETTEFTAAGNLHEIDQRWLFQLRVNGDDFPSIAPSLSGRFQIKNATAAATAAWQLAREGFQIPHEAVVEGIRTASWPGRLEVIHEHPLVVLDGAHNPAAARVIADHVRTHWQDRFVRLVYGSMRDKAIGEISETLFPLADEVILAQPDQARAATPQEILADARIRPKGLMIEPDPARAVELAISRSSSNDVVLAVGSLFLVGAIKKALAEARLRLGKNRVDAADLPNGVELHSR